LYKQRPSFSIMHQTYRISVQERNTILTPQFALNSSKQTVRHRNCPGKLPNTFGFRKLVRKWYFGT